MPVTAVFRCQFCAARPDPDVQAEFVRQMQDAHFGRYVVPRPLPGGGNATSAKISKMGGSGFAM